MNRRDFMIAAGAGACAGWSAIAGTNNTAVPATPMKVLLWCWDTRMTWDDEPHLIQLKMAASDQHFSYTKCSESFQIGFRRLVDYCAENDIWGIVLWGFLRDAHGGVAAAQDLCLYARDRNVTIIPGVGLCAYGGYYYAGDHPFNLDTYLHKHPERASIAYEEGSGRKVQGVLDPSLPENQQWWRDGLEWMLETFAIGGINYEMGDFIINASQKAQTARRALGFNADGNILDMVVATHDLIERAYTLQPNGIFINALYRGYHQIRTLPDIPYVNAMNPKTVWQYTLTHMQRDEAFPDGFGDIPAHRQYGYLHWFNASTNTIAKDYTMDIARVFPAAQQLGFEFIGTYGELRANTPIADRNYRAQAAWAKNPALQYKDFE